MSGRRTTAIVTALTRRRAMTSGTAALIVAPFVVRSGFAQSPAVNIGVIQPLSGANAQFGINCRNGIEFVADAVNAAGGIKALGGAKINLIVSDATSNPITAPAVAQRLIAQNELTAVLGAYASSLTLAISEVTARADIPFLTQAYADEITGRSLESVFKVTAKASVIGLAQVNSLSRLQKRPAARSRRSRSCTRTPPTASPNLEACAGPQRTPTLRL